MTDLTLDALPSVQLLQPQPGDIVIVQYPGKLGTVLIRQQVS